MAGGTWKSQNKIRPGAYINFKEYATPLIKVGDRGIATIALPLKWGAEGSLIEVLSSDLVDGKSRAKVGFTAFDTADSLALRLILQNCYKCLVYRTTSGGVKASANATAFVATAKYSGSKGNLLTIQVADSKFVTGNFRVTTFFDGLEVDAQEIHTVADLVDNDFVTFTDSEQPLVEVASAVFTGGTDGTATNSTAYPAYFNLLKTARWQVMALIEDHATINPLALTFIKNMRDDNGRKVQLCTYDYETADYEGVISSDQGYKTATETITPQMFPAFVAGITAGAKVNESNTYKTVNDAVSITGELTNEEIIVALGQGKFVISSKQDGTIVVEKDINTFTSFEPTKNYTFSKNRAIRVMDEIATSILTVWENSYVGKVSNSTTGRALFKADVIAYIKELQRIEAVDLNYTPEDNITVDKGVNIDAVVGNIYKLPVLDAMEILYLDIEVKG